MLRFKKFVRLLAMDGLMLRMHGCIRAVLAMDGLMLRMHGCIRAADLGKISSIVDGH